MQSHREELDVPPDNDAVYACMVGKRDRKSLVGIVEPFISLPGMSSKNRFFLVNWHWKSIVNLLPSE
jgi:hypothetical protein